MAAIIDAIFENGVFRLLRPVGLGERQAVRLHVEPAPPPSAPPGGTIVYPQHMPPAYPDEEWAAEDDGYQPVPMTEAGTAMVVVTDAGPWPPPVWPEE